MYELSEDQRDLKKAAERVRRFRALDEIGKQRLELCKPQRCLAPAHGVDDVERVAGAGGHAAAGIELPEGHSETVAGFVIDRLGRLPRVGDKVEVAGHVLTVTATDAVGTTATDTLTVTVPTCVRGTTVRVPLSDSSTPESVTT